MGATQAFADIYFIQMGGTIDKHYPANPTNHGYDFVVGPPAFTRIINRVIPDSKYWSWNALQVDSVDMTDEERLLVAERLQGCRCSKIIITHGTDTIHQTAEFFSRHSQGKRTVVLTGAMQPELFRESDADFNLGMATAAVGILPPGLYIALHGEVKKWNEFVPQ